MENSVESVRHTLSLILYVYSYITVQHYSDTPKPRSKYLGLCINPSKLTPSTRSGSATLSGPSNHKPPKPCFTVWALRFEVEDSISRFRSSTLLPFCFPYSNQIAGKRVPALRITNEAPMRLLHVVHQPCTTADPKIMNDSRVCVCATHGHVCVYVYIYR